MYRRLLAGRPQNGHILDFIQLVFLQYQFLGNSEDLEDMLIQILNCSCRDNDYVVL